MFLDFVDNFPNFFADFLIPYLLILCKLDNLTLIVKSQLSYGLVTTSFSLTKILFS